MSLWGSERIIPLMPPPPPPDNPHYDGCQYLGGCVPSSRYEAMKQRLAVEEKRNEILMEQLVATVARTINPVWILPEDKLPIAAPSLSKPKIYQPDGIRYWNYWHPGHRTWVHHWSLVGTDHVYEFATSNEEATEAQHREAQYTLYITPTKKESTLNVRENAGAMLGQVQSHLANVEGQLKTKTQELADTRKALAQERGLRTDGARALYVSLDGSTRNAAITAGPEGPLREVRFEELTPGSVHYIEDPRHYGAYIRPVRRVYRLAFSTPKLLVYQEIG